MRNVLIINQPLSNRGDEAAHRALLRALDKDFPDSKITVLFLNAKQGDIEDFTVKSSRIVYKNITGSSKGIAFLQRWSLRLNMIFLAFLLPVLNKYSRYVKEADVVICAPGGICMGLFQSWSHIFNLSLVKYYNKKLIYYSRSFGTFPIETEWNRVFKKNSYRLLNSFDFLSIRDTKTMKLADELNLSYIPSIDTAFLDRPNVEIPDEINNIIGDGKFAVFVPNSLTWHAAYKENSQEDIDSFFLEIFELLLANNLKVVMLPQLSQHILRPIPDYNYFLRLKGMLKNSDNVFVIRDTYSSDLQQTIISKSELVIGARYHSVVFAINNCTPFISLSYEHKMTGLLDLLDLQEREVNIAHLGNSNFDRDFSLQKIEQLLSVPYPNAKEIQEKAYNMALNTFNSLKEYYDKEIKKTRS